MIALLKQLRITSKYHQYELKKAQELLRMMTPSQKDLEREYNKREIEYYNKRSFRCWQS